VAGNLNVVTTHDYFQTFFGRSAASGRVKEREICVQRVYLSALSNRVLSIVPVYLLVRFSSHTLLHIDIRQLHLSQSYYF
jgi:hypothetical protein